MLTFEKVLYYNIGIVTRSSEGKRSNRSCHSGNAIENNYQLVDVKKPQLSGYILEKRFNL